VNVKASSARFRKGESAWERSITKIKEWVHDFVKKYPGSVAVGIHPYPALIPVTSVYGEKYVRSKANDSPDDNLLKLPRE
jgi:hypothetical protein